MRHGLELALVVCLLGAGCTKEPDGDDTGETPRFATAFELGGADVYFPTLGEQGGAMDVVFGRRIDSTQTFDLVRATWDDGDLVEGVFAEGASSPFVTRATLASGDLVLVYATPDSDTYAVTVMVVHTEGSYTTFDLGAAAGVGFEFPWWGSGVAVAGSAPDALYFAGPAGPPEDASDGVFYVVRYAAFEDTTWTAESIEEIQGPEGSAWLTRLGGMDIALDGDGVPHVVYFVQDYEAGLYSLKEAARGESGWETSTVWTIEIADGPTRRALGKDQPPTLDVAVDLAFDASDTAHLLWTVTQSGSGDEFEHTGHTFYGVDDGSGWTLQHVPDGGAADGSAILVDYQHLAPGQTERASMVLDDSGTPHLAYGVLTDGDPELAATNVPDHIEYAILDDLGWSTTTVRNVSSSFMSTDLALSPAGVAYVAANTVTGSWLRVDE